MRIHFMLSGLLVHKELRNKQIVRKLKPTERMHSFRWFDQHYFKVSIKKVFIFVTKIIIWILW